MKPSGRQIGKLSHSNPGIIFAYVSYVDLLSLIIKEFCIALSGL